MGDLTDTFDDRADFGGGSRSRGRRCARAHGKIDTGDIGWSMTDPGSRADLIHAEVNIGDLRWVPDPPDGTWPPTYVPG